MITGNVIGGILKTPDTFILVDDEGNEYVGAVTGEEAELDATVNDVRLGKTAALARGVEVGEKEIPSYNTEEGYIKIEPGGSMKIDFFSDQCQYTKLQAIICTFNTTPSDSVAATMVSIDSKVYLVNSTESLSNVKVDNVKQTIDLDVTNNSETAVIIRYFTYKEKY